MLFTKLVTAAATGAVLVLPAMPVITPMAHTIHQDSAAEFTRTATAGLVRSDLGDPPGNRSGDDGNGNTGGYPGGGVHGHKGCSSDGNGSCGTH
jgi:hypothetical protein